ncbi:16S rRNA (cytosine(967)-C(5))-methyltransferase RsmB [Peptostreptococcus canis]|uniref:16S rRNA (cytosine(967)-C(5))-methyltransferase n=1 Tax=Peptostreptococcus canis TaxID=1159213 RepID=A0ABR6TJR5_9FIRM|nr:16S rRNA (cytosine(967)-C(5))-methyltransferase RsmB [Peptostreptococcus canis]MBC2575644.1 16S rRNA (cytosine(967)-C(5))-methyltransferase RsmB [Peptostreptococcus canis]MBP1997151.1 16S rRNA (cytosine967-C5)-methyltransferase [Peptostreptococcus canis]
MSARDIAYNILMDVEINKNYSNTSLNSFLRKSNLNDIDKGFITELVYGVIENKRYIDYIINKVSKIKVRKMSHCVKVVLRMGVYQLLFLDGVADYAAINESVNMIKKVDRKSSNFVNAVLRNISRKSDVTYIDENSIDNLSIKYSYNTWIVEKLVEEYGFEKTREIIRSLSEKPKIYVRININKVDEFLSFNELKSYIIDEFKKCNIEAKCVSGIDIALELVNFKNIDNNRLFKMGYISVQDISSMMVGLCMNPRQNSRVLDICAAPGGKTTHIAEIMRNTGEVISQDIYEHKMALINNYAKRLELSNIHTRLQDALILDEENIEKFDYVLCDVPCSGMGIVRRKPEIKYKDKEDIEKLPEIQLNILKNASKYVKENGILIYSTCTMFKDENMDIVKRFLSENRDFQMERIDLNNIESESLKEGFIQILPNTNKMDGFFICKLKKRNKLNIKNI